MSKKLPANAQKKFNEFRKEIDQADHELIKTLARRFRTVEKVGKLKREHELPIYQRARWAEVVEDRVKNAKKNKIGEAFMRSLLKLIHKEAVRVQRGKK